MWAPPSRQGGFCGEIDMTVQHTRILVLVAVVIGLSTLLPSSHLHAQRTLDEWRALAEQGDVEEQYGLAQLYRTGQGIP